jgi:hypothetical protein
MTALGTLPRSRRLATAVFLAAMVRTVLLTLPAAADTPDSEDAPELTDPGPWIFAAEDTLEIPAFFEMSLIEVRADRVTIGEIVQRCIDRERELAERIRSHEFTLLAKGVFSIGGTSGAPDRQLVTEVVQRRFFAAPDRRKTIVLKEDRYELRDGERHPWDPDEDGDSSVSVSFDDLQELPFYLENHEDYDFEILTREIVGNGVLYEVALRPRSDFDIAPSGRIWIDTSTYSILREEFDFGDRVPMPLLVRSVGPFIRERERIGDLWVWKRLLMRAQIRGGLFRWLDKDIPDVVEFQLTFRDHRINEGWSTQETAEGADEVHQ